MEVVGHTSVRVLNSSIRYLEQGTIPEVVDVVTETESEGIPRISKTP